jgi:PIN domain nuclease of toxin-antitoxin system
VLLLDTHVWIWSVQGDTRVGRRARQLLARAEARAEIRVSVMTVFEVAALHALGRLRLARSLDQWIREALSAAGIYLADISPDIAIDAGVIPRESLADPLDRLLVASARQLDAALLTGDARILDYASGSRNVRVVDARV